MTSEYPAPPPQHPPQNASDMSLGDLLGRVSTDISTLMRQEVALAKAELTDTAKKTGKGAGLLGGAGYAGIMALLFLSIAAWWGLGYLIGNAWSAVVVAVVYAIVAAILFAVGRSKLKDVEGAPQTVATIKEIPDTLNPNGDHR
ncbi:MULTISPECIES: phage holin family protein [unclassified Pseudoclavibacter]|uniref:phage holin family protein n=1 Tax=unclassified Pseudoclavibacter TaxID=2615177 RepID=UPI001BA63E50|nr:phage holin family protein [Pseudoclavibacter sp. Marseille-Q4354]MBS3180117.1 phage holin family protein [Pseudoclavibacter sp. Marseille-Q4354]